jgi:hypothetical protein
MYPEILKAFVVVALGPFYVCTGASGKVPPPPSLSSPAHSISEK